MSSNWVLRAQNLGKDYVLYNRIRSRLRHLLFSQGGGSKVFHALQGVKLELCPGESLGVIGQNGAGKSTLLQLLCGTLTPSHGTLEVRGRIAPLLELGAGFNMEFTGRENIFMNAAVLGLSHGEILGRLQEIIDFADIGEFIDQPVRTYSSGMYVRLAFAIATRISPDILVIDEAISVGDGQFARKSFDRILQLREEGVTLLFCSHSMFQVEALCERALWLHQGKVMAYGPSSQVVVQYNAWLNAQQVQPESGQAPATLTRGHATLSHVEVGVDGIWSGRLNKETLLAPLHSGKSQLALRIQFNSDPALSAPTLAMVISTADGRMLASACSWIDGASIKRNQAGAGGATLVYDNLPLLKGKYTLSIYLMCERGLHVYDAAEHVTTITVSQEHLEQGMVSLPHLWHSEVPS